MYEQNLTKCVRNALAHITFLTNLVRNSIHSFHRFYRQYWYYRCHYFCNCILFPYFFYSLISLFSILHYITTSREFCLSSIHCLDLNPNSFRHNYSSITLKKTLVETYMWFFPTCRAQQRYFVFLSFEEKWKNHRHNQTCWPVFTRGQQRGYCRQRKPHDVRMCAYRRHGVSL